MATTPVETTDATFNDDLPAEGIAVIDFWAPWCGPCRSFAPVFAASAEANPDVAHLKVNVDDNPHLAGYFGVQSIPTTVVVRDGVRLTSAVGAMGEAALATLLVEARAADMDDVARRLAADS
jgi:thioredoxin 1